MALERTPEPELMDGLEQVRAYAAADFNDSDQAMCERLVELCGGHPGPQLVDLGCGPGNITFRLARRWPDAAVLGLDGAPQMLAVARQRSATQPELAGRLLFEQALLPLVDPGEWEGAFSMVVSNSLLHHLHDPGVFWRAVREAGSPGAAVLVMDLFRPESVSAAQAIVGSSPAPGEFRRRSRA